MQGAMSNVNESQVYAFLYANILAVGGRFDP